MRKECVVWGTRATGRQVAEWATELGYHVIAFCSSRISSQEKEIGSLKVILPEDLKNYCLAGKIDSILLGVRNPEYQKEIEDICRREMPAGVPLIHLRTIENEYLNYIGDHIRYCWNVKFEEQSKIWLENFQSEVNFWVNCVAKTGSFYHSDYRRWLSNVDFLGIDSTCKDLAETLHAGSIVMDIGCGLASVYGCRLPNGESIQLLAVDPLAPFYNRINQKCVEGKNFPICQFGLFEFIANFYKKDTFDAILINNALDHCIDPYKSVLECLYVLNFGKIMRLKHRRAEAVYEDWNGLHKWNIDVNQKNELIFWNKENAINISKALSGIAAVEVTWFDRCSPREKQEIVVEIVKKKDFKLEEFLDMEQERYQLASFSKGLMNWISSHVEDYLQDL